MPIVLYVLIIDGGIFMANPVITDVKVKYANDRGYKLPGEVAELFIEAFDSDNKTISVTVTVKDSSGSESAVKTVEVLQTDELNYSITSEDGVTITQDPLAANHFFVV
jgi:hypothetical protein